MSFDIVSVLRTLCVLVVVAYAVVAALMYVNQRSYQYFPGRQGLSASAVGLGAVEDLKLKTSDGETLQAWYAKAPPGRPTILYLHGNGGEIADRAERFAAYQARGFGVLFLSYRGYGASTGSPSEAGLVRDALSAHDWLTAQGVKPEAIALVGESLGGGVAVQLATERKVGVLALEAPFSAAVNIAAAAYWWLPVRLLMKDQFRSADFIDKVHVPLLVIHGDEDGVVPVEEGRALFAAANEPKRMIVVPGGTHGSIFSPETWASEMVFFEQHAGH